MGASTAYTHAEYFQRPKGCCAEVCADGNDLRIPRCANITPNPTGCLFLLQVEVVTGILDTFIVEPFVPHEQSDEYYVCINSNREGEEFLFCHEGGVDVGDVDAKADRLQVGQRLP